jgi:hypothetical protein
MLPYLMLLSHFIQLPSPSPGLSFLRDSFARPCRCGTSAPRVFARFVFSSKLFRIRTSKKHASNSRRIRTFKTQDLKGDYVFDTDACYGREIVAGECLVGILRTRRPCYHARRMKVEKRKFDQALKKMLRAKPEPRKKIKTRGRRGVKTPILAKP